MNDGLSNAHSAAPLAVMDVVRWQTALEIRWLGQRETDGCHTMRRNRFRWRTTRQNAYRIDCKRV